LASLSKVEIRRLAGQIDQLRRTDPDEARRLLWAIALRYGRSVALDVTAEMFARAQSRLAKTLPDRAA
jgi:hypothetical protein